MRITLIFLLFLIGCTAVPEPALPYNLTIEEPEPNLSANTTQPKEQPLTEAQQKRILQGQFNFSLLTGSNCEYYTTLFHLNITDTKEALKNINADIGRTNERLDTLLEQLGQTTPGTNAWKKIKDNYDEEQIELDNLETRQRNLEKRLPNMDYTIQEMKNDCKRLKAQPLNIP